MDEEAVWKYLVELLEEASEEEIYDNEQLADFLMDHGVTVEKED